MKKWQVIFLVLLVCFFNNYANSIFIPMDEKQTNHLKAYGIAYWVLQKDAEVKWLVNYKGGSFMVNYSQAIENECLIRGVSYDVISDANALSIQSFIYNPNLNCEVVNLLKTAKIAVYSPIKVSEATYEDTDAVLLVLRYAEIPFEVVYDEEVMNGELAKYDWLHLHHEDFTGQFGKDTRRMSARDFKAQEDLAKKFGYKKMSAFKLEVAKAIKGFCAGGGYLFAMCSGSESLDVALAADGVDIVPSQFDGDGMDAKVQEKLNFEKALAFENFFISSEEFDGERRGGPRSFSDINIGLGSGWGGFSEEEIDSYFNLFEFSAKWDVIPALLTQNHQNTIREFMGQTT